MFLPLLLYPLVVPQGPDFLPKDQFFGQKAMEMFGFASAGGGDVEGDGIDEVVVGAHGVVQAPAGLPLILTNMVPVQIF